MKDKAKAAKQNVPQIGMLGQNDEVFSKSIQNKKRADNFKNAYTRGKTVSAIRNSSKNKKGSDNLNFVKADSLKTVKDKDLSKMDPNQLLDITNKRSNLNILKIDKQMSSD